MTIAKITLDEHELEEQKWHPQSLQIAMHLFKVHGFLSIENLFPVPFIEKLYFSYLNRLEVNEDQTEIKNASKVSHRRYIVPIELKGPFNQPQLYANPLLLELLRALLGKHTRLSSIGSVTSLPGATDQHVHADYFPLFDEQKDIGGTLPPYAITVAIPLVDIDLLNGPTKIWSGSHLVYPIDQKMLSYSRHLLCGKKGCCHLWDYRTLHAGGSNHSDSLRPLLYMAYARRWFSDMLNPDQLKIAKEEYESLSSEHRELLAVKSELIA